MNKFVITIGRQIGAGGLISARLLADEFGIKLYDRELITKAAESFGISAEFFAMSDEKTNKRGLRAFLSTIAGSVSSDNMLSDDALFRMQSEVIRRIADTESCIFVGRCADYILRDHPNRVSVFITADLQQRASRMAAEWDVSLEDAINRIERDEKHRAEYYNYFTFKQWGHASSYDLCIDSSRVGGEAGVVEQVKLFMKQSKMI